MKASHQSVIALLAALLVCALPRAEVFPASGADDPSGARGEKGIQPEMYVVDTRGSTGRAPDRLYRAPVANFTQQALIGATNHRLFAIDFSADVTVLYGAVSATASVNASTFGTINLATGAYTPIGPLGLTGGDVGEGIRPSVRGRTLVELRLCDDLAGRLVGQPNRHPDCRASRQCARQETTTAADEFDLADPRLDHQRVTRTPIPRCAECGELEIEVLLDLGNGRRFLHGRVGGEPPYFEHFERVERLARRRVVRDRRADFRDASRKG